MRSLCAVVPAGKLRLPEVPRGSVGLYSRGVRSYHTWVDTKPATLALSAKAGLVYGDMTVIDVDSLKAEKSVPVGRLPWGVAIMP